MKTNQKTKLFLSLATLVAVLLFGRAVFGIAPTGDYFKGKTTQTESLPKKIFGLTIDDNDKTKNKNLKKSLEKIKGRGEKIVVRIVFDFNEYIFNGQKRDFTKEDFAAEAEEYKTFIKKYNLRKYAFIMGEIADSDAVHFCRQATDSVACMSARTEAYAEVLSELVDIWEIGNEVNAEWVGWQKEAEWKDENVTVEQMENARLLTSREITAAYNALKQNSKTAAKPTAITFYYNDDTVHHGWTDD